MKIRIFVNGNLMKGKEYKKYLSEYETPVVIEVEEDGINIKFNDTLKIDDSKGYDRIANSMGYSIGQSTMRNESYIKLITGKGKCAKTIAFVRERYLLVEANKEKLNDRLNDAIETLIELKKYINK